MKPNYKNWIPKGMLYALAAGTVLALAGMLVFGAFGVGVHGGLRIALGGIFAAAFLVCGKSTQWCICAYNAFSYDGGRQLSKQIIDGTADYIILPEGGAGLDVGCGSGALTVACAKRNPQGKMLGIDRWGLEYASFSQKLCEKNAAAEGVKNVSFRHGDAVKLDFPDESFDAVTSNYVYHNISSADKQALLLETLRVLKKGGTFAIHDLMSPRRYGDMQAFVKKLQDMGYEKVELIDTTDGKFMSKAEARRLMLTGSTLLVAESNVRTGNEAAAVGRGKNVKTIMLPFLIEAIAICLLFPVSCIFLVRRIMEHLEPAKPNHWAEIVQRLIDLGMISGVDTPHGFRQGDISHV